MGTLPPVKHYIDGHRVYTLPEAVDLLHTAGHNVNYETLRKRLRRTVQPAGWINGRLAVYHPSDLGLPE